MPESEDFTGDVSLEDFKKVFRAHGVEVDDVEVEGEHTPMIRIMKGDDIEVFDADPVIYKGKAQRLARKYGVPIPDLYKADQYK